MAVGISSNARFIIQNLKAELEAIVRENGHRVDVKTVVSSPSYGPLDPAMYGVDSPSLHVWVMDSTVAGDKIGRPERFMTVWIAGVMKQEDDLQGSLIDFAESVRGVMLFNPARDISSVTPNTWGVTTIEDAEGIAYEIDGRDGGPVGTFMSKWRIEYVYPNPIG